MTEKMQVVILSRGRPDRARTLRWIDVKRWQPMLVVPSAERTAYMIANPGVVVVGLDYVDIRDKRQKVTDCCHGGKLLMLDDDLTFYKRHRYGKIFVKIHDEIQTTEMLRAIEQALDAHAHVGVADKFMSQTLPRGGTEGRRYNQVLGYNLDVARPEFRVAINEEHDAHLGLVRRGHPGYVLTEWSKGSTVYAAGGCSAWRSPEIEMRAHEEFAALWPRYVTVTENVAAISGRGVRVAWSKAYMEMLS